MIKKLRLLLIPLISVFLSACLYQSIGKSTGAFLDPVKGKRFVHISNDLWNSNQNALIYFYRPHSKWAAEEVESPDVYIDGKSYFNFRDNSFTWFEVYPGKIHIVIRRPLLGLEGMGSFNLDKITDKVLNVKAGHLYHLRYSEIKPPPGVNNEIPPDSVWGQGDLQLVTRDVAMKEIIYTQFLKPDALAPNHAGASIVKATRTYDYLAKKKELLKQREEEIKKLKAKGKWKDAPWYWPFGHKLHPALKTDQKITALEKKRQKYLAYLASQKPPKKWYWPF